MKTKISILLLFISYGLLAQEPAAIYGGDIIGIKDAPAPPKDGAKTKYSCCDMLIKSVSLKMKHYE